VKLKLIGEKKSEKQNFCELGKAFATLQLIGCIFRSDGSEAR
jgi:hypothetical protein